VEEKNTNLERENRKFKNQLQQLMKDYKDLKEKIKGKDDSELKKDVDILKQIRSRFSSSRDGEKDE
jgi:hypothetical protein